MGTKNKITGCNLLVIGAGPNQVPAIRLAKDKGFFVVATDMDSNAEGSDLTDRFGVISTRDIEGSIAFARQVHTDNGLDGVMTMASESAVTVARIAEDLGLPGLNPQAAWRATHKVERQRCFKKYNIPSPRFDSATTITEGVEKAYHIGWPIVVKPADSAGSRGVRKVDAANELSDAVAEIRTFSNESEYLIEEFLCGSEHSIEGIVIDGEVHWTGFSDRNYDKKEIYQPYFLEDGDTLPTTLSPEVFNEVRSVSETAVRALGIDWGPVKGDILIDEGGPKVLEMAARLSGDYFCYETVPLHTGVNILEAVMNQAVGLPVDPSSLIPQYNHGVALRYVWPKPGKVKKIIGVDQVRSMAGVHFFKWEPRWRNIGIGTEIVAARSMGERVGCVMTKAETREEAILIAETAINTIQITTE